MDEFSNGVSPEGSNSSMFEEMNELQTQPGFHFHWFEKVFKVEFAKNSDNLHYLKLIHAVHFTGNQGRDTGKLLSLCWTMIQCN